MELVATKTSPLPATKALKPRVLQEPPYSGTCRRLVGQHQRDRSSSLKCGTVKKAIGFYLRDTGTCRRPREVRRQKMARLESCQSLQEHLSSGTVQKKCNVSSWVNGRSGMRGYEGVGKLAGEGDIRRPRYGNPRSTEISV